MIVNVSDGLACLANPRRISDGEREFVDHVAAARERDCLQLRIAQCGIRRRARVQVRLEAFLDLRREEVR